MFLPSISIYKYRMQYIWNISFIRTSSRFLKYISKSQFSCSADGDSGRVIPAQVQSKKRKGEVALTWDRWPGNRWAFLEGWETAVTERGHASHHGSVATSWGQPACLPAPWLLLRQWLLCFHHQFVIWGGFTISPSLALKHVWFSTAK